MPSASPNDDSSILVVLVDQNKDLPYSHQHWQPSGVHCRIMASAMLNHSVRSCATSARFFILPRCLWISSPAVFGYASISFPLAGFPHREVMSPFFIHASHMHSSFPFLFHDGWPWWNALIMSSTQKKPRLTFVEFARVPNDSKDCSYSH